MERNILAEARRRKIRLTVDKFNESKGKTVRVKRSLQNIKNELNRNRKPANKRAARGRKFPESLRANAKKMKVTLTKRVNGKRVYKTLNELRTNIKAATNKKPVKKAKAKKINSAVKDAWNAKARWKYLQYALSTGALDPTPGQLRFIKYYKAGKTRNWSNIPPIFPNNTTNKNTPISKLNMQALFDAAAREIRNSGSNEAGPAEEAFWAGMQYIRFTNPDEYNKFHAKFELLFG
jgi:hypothetical protein